MGMGLNYMYEPVPPQTLTVLQDDGMTDGPVWFTVHFLLVLAPPLIRCSANRGKVTASTEPAAGGFVQDLAPIT